MSTPRSFRIGLLAVAVALGSVLGCRSADPNEIRVGAFLSLSGADSTFGSDTREGIALATEEVNASGGIKGKRVRVLYEDDKSTTYEAVLKVRQLIDRNKVVALLGEVASSRSLAGGLVANMRKVPMITPSSTAVDVTRNRKWVFRTCFTDDQQGQVAARFVVSDLGRSRVGIFFAAQDTYSSGLARAFRDEIKRLGKTVVIDKGYPKGETNFRTYLAEIQAAGPDVVFVPNYYNEMVLVARQAHELGIPGSMFVGGDGWDSSNLVEGAGAELEGAHFTNHYAPDVPWENSSRFFRAYMAKYGHEPTSLAAQGYDSASVLFFAMSETEHVSPTEIRDRLEGIRDFRGATGVMTIDADHNAQKPIVVVRVTGSAFKFATQLTANAKDKS